MTATSPQQSIFTSFRFFPAEREVFKKKEDLSVSEWAARYRTVTMGAHVGPWRNEIAPYLALIMDTWALPCVRELVICKTAQTGGTEAMYNCLAYVTDRDPSVMMVVMSAESVAQKVSEDRIIPMLKESPRLNRLLSDNPDDTAKRRVRLRNGALLYMAWANSTSALATFPVKYILFDETDKYPSTVGKETDPITLGKKRARTHRYTYKTAEVSTPTREDGHIWKAFTGADAEYRYFPKCTECGCEQLFSLDQLKYPEGKTPEEIRRDHLAHYDCEGCGAEWNDRMRDAAVRAGGWKKTRGADIPRPRKVAFHLPGWISPDVSLSELAAAFVSSRGDRARLIDFYNDYMAEPYIERLSERREDAIMALRDDRPRGVVPRDASCLLCLIDTQQRGFYYEVRAFGWGPSLESWQVREGFVETFEGLKDVIYKSDYRDADGKAYAVAAAFIDSGGGAGGRPKHSRTAEVYEFCRLNPVVRPIKGRQRLASAFSPAKIDYYPQTKKPIPGGLTLYHINVTYCKDHLASKLAINPGDPGAWHLHSECPPEYARHMTAEYRDEKGAWQCPKGRDNHYWDIGVYALAAAEILQIKFWKRPEEAPARPAGRRVLSRGFSTEP